MGLFDYFSKERANERKKENCLKKLTNMYYQKADRLIAAEQAAEIAAGGDDEAIIILLRRFEHMTQNGTNDREEKEFCAHLLVDLGSKAIGPIQGYLRNENKPVYWPLQVLQDLLSKEQLTEFVTELVGSMDNDYVRDPEKKLGLIQFAGDLSSPALRDALVPFLEDHAENVRVRAIDALEKYGEEAPSEAFAARLLDEDESLRLQNKVATIIAERQWSLGAHAEAIASAPPKGFVVKGDTLVAR